MAQSHRFGGVEVFPIERTLTVDGRQAHLGSRAFELLVMLLENVGRVVAKDELLDRVWPGLIVEEANIQVQVSTLRKVIGHHCIATVPGRGYRFSATLDVLDRSGQQEPPLSPIARARLHGRDADCEAVAALVTGTRVVTVVGPGGIGKTSLAAVVCDSIVARFADGACWVDLAPLISKSQIHVAVARAIGIDSEGDGTRLLTALRDRQLLLVLDNCEHVVEAAAKLANRIFKECSRVHVFATSQEPLQIQAERVYRLESLSIPPADALYDYARTFGSVQLLEDRVQSHERGFRLDSQNVAVAIDLCRQIDGNPLAIEMAAGRVPLLGLDGVVGRLHERLQLLKGSRRDLPARQRSLQATLEWSHALLSEAEQVVFRRISVFSSSFRLDSLQRIATDGAIDEWDVVEALSSLVDKSLVQVEVGEPPRYRLLESVRIFAAEQLALAVEGSHLRRAHLLASSRSAQCALAEFWATPDEDWLRRHGPDQADLEAAFREACRTGDAVAGAPVVALLCRIDSLNGVSTAVRERKAAVHALMPAADDPLARALLWGCLSWHNAIVISDVPRLIAATEAAATWRCLGDRSELYQALWQLAVELATFGARDEARSASAEATSLEDPAWPARLRWFGANAANDLALLLGDHGDLRSRFEGALELAEAAGSLRCAARTRLNYADHALAQGDVEEALTSGRIAVSQLRCLGQPSALGWALSNLSGAELWAGNELAAATAAAEALPLMWANGWGTDLLNHVALLCVRRGCPESAAMLLGYSRNSYALSSDMPLVNESRLAAEVVKQLDRRAAAREVERWSSKGAQLNDKDALALARSILLTQAPASCA